MYNQVAPQLHVLYDWLRSGFEMRLRKAGYVEGYSPRKEIGPFRCLKERLHRAPCHCNSARLVTSGPGGGNFVTLPANMRSTCSAAIYNGNELHSPGSTKSLSRVRFLNRFSISLHFVDREIAILSCWESIRDSAPHRRNPKLECVFVIVAL
jgi:hypothetical protein